MVLARVLWSFVQLFYANHYIISSVRASNNRFCFLNGGCIVLLPFTSQVTTPVTLVTTGPSHCYAQSLRFLYMIRSQKLRRLGLVGDLWNWFRAYRCQCVNVNGCKSSILPVISQMSLRAVFLGLILYTTIALLVKHSHMFMFADDAKCLRSVTCQLLSCKGTLTFCAHGMISGFWVSRFKSALIFTSALRSWYTMHQWYGVEICWRA